MSVAHNRISRYFPGTSLEAYLDVRGLLTPEELLPLARQVAAQMRAMHEQGILHSDLRPGNLLLQRTGGRWQVEVVGFGDNALSLAGAITPAEDVRGFGRTCCAALLGTPEPTEHALKKLPLPWRGLLRRCAAPAGEKGLLDFAAVLDCLTLIHANRPPRPRRVLPPGITGLLCLTLVGALGGAMGEVLLTRSARGINGVTVAMAVGTGSALAAAGFFAALALRGYVVFGEMVGEVEEPATAGEASSLVARSLSAAVEACGGVLWGVVCGAAVGTVAGGLYLLCGEQLMVIGGAVPLGTLAGIVVGASLGAVIWTRRKRAPLAAP